jgi:hypothetical protein
MKKIILTCIALAFLATDANAGYTSMGRRSGYTSMGSRSIGSSRITHTSHTRTIYRRSGSSGSGAMLGLATGMLVGSAISHSHGHYGGAYYNDGYTHGGHYGRGVNVCMQDPDYNDYVLRKCAGDSQCVRWSCIK